MVDVKKTTCEGCQRKEEELKCFRSELQLKSNMLQSTMDQISNLKSTVQKFVELFNR